MVVVASGICARTDRWTDLWMNGWLVDLDIRTTNLGVDGSDANNDGSDDGLGWLTGSLATSNKYVVTVGQVVAV